MHLISLPGNWDTLETSQKSDLIQELLIQIEIDAFHPDLYDNMYAWDQVCKERGVYQGVVTFALTIAAEARVFERRQADRKKPLSILDASWQLAAKPLSRDQVIAALQRHADNVVRWYNS
jgi:hypothetical protein